MSPSRQCLLLYYLIVHVGSHNAPSSHNEEPPRHHDHSHLNSLLKERNLVSVEQLDEATPFPTKVKPPHSNSQDNTAGFINPELGSFINDLTASGASSRLDAQGLAAMINQQRQNRNPDSLDNDDPNSSGSVTRTSASLKSLPNSRNEPAVNDLGDSENAKLPKIKSAATLYNEAVEKLIKSASESNIPLVEGYNYSIPEPSSIGNGAELPSLFEIVGHNLGNSMGSTAGNLLGGTSNLISNYAEAVQGGFSSVLGGGNSPLAEQLSSLGLNLRRLADGTASAQLSESDANDSEGSTINENPSSLGHDESVPQPPLTYSPHLFPFEGVPLGYPYQGAISPYWYMNQMLANPAIPSGIPTTDYGLPPYLTPPVYQLPGMGYVDPSRRADWEAYKSSQAIPTNTMGRPSQDPNPADTIRNRWPSVSSNVGESIGSSVGNSLGNSLASDLNLIHGVANSAAENFFNVFNTGIVGRPTGPTRATAEGAAPSAQLRRLLESSQLLPNTGLPGTNSQGASSLGNLFSSGSGLGLGNLNGLNGQQNGMSSLQQQLAALMGNNAGNANPLGNLLGTPSNSGLGNLNSLLGGGNGGSFQGLGTPSSILGLGNSGASSGLGSSGSLSGLGNLGLNSGSHLGSTGSSLGNAGLPSGLGTPSILPGASTSNEPAKSPTQLWNEAIEKLQNDVQKLGLPTLNGYNASLPEISTIGNGAGLPELSSQIGSNVGNSMGNTLGNTLSGSASLVGSTASNIKESFLSSFSPVLTNFMGMFGGPEAGKKLRRLATSTNTASNSCVQKDVAYSSSESSVLNNIYSVEECQRICQTYSSPLLISGCNSVKSTLPADKSACVGVSFTQASGRCSLFFSVNGDYTVDGIDSAPVVCSGSQFLQPVTEFLTLIKSNEAAACLMKSGVSIIPVEDSVRPNLTITSKANISETLPVFTNDKAESSDIWKYNPDTPSNLAEVIETNVVYQVQQSSADIPMGKSSWGAKSGVKDWRYCALLCGKDTDCRYWTYQFSPELYKQYGGSCALATNKEPQGKAVGSTQTIAGPRLTVYPEALFGSQSESKIRRLFANMLTRSWSPDARSPPARGDNEPYVPGMLDSSLSMGHQTPNRRLEANKTDVGSCQDYGLVYYSPFDSRTSNAKALGAGNVGNVTQCEAECRGAEGCVAYQFVPEPLLTGSERLQQGQAKNCLLLSAVDRKVAGDPTIVSGVVPSSNATSCDLASKPSMSPVKSNSWTQNDGLEGQTHNASSTESSEDDADVDDDSATSVEGLKKEVSLHGTLLSNTTNVFRTKDPKECEEKCDSNSDCMAFSWGRWGGCYLFSDYSREVADVDVVSKAKVKLDFEHDIEGGSGRRSIFRCDRSQRGLVYTEASVLQNLTDVKSSDECFSKCRQTQDCYYMTFIDLDGVKEFAARSLYSVESRRRLQEDMVSSLCLLFSAVKESKTVQPRLAISAETNCDVEGELDFGSETWIQETFSKIQYPAVITAATLGGVALIAVGASVITRRRMNKKRRKTNVATLDASPMTDMSKTPSGVNSLKNRNAFGMTSPIAASPGSVDRMERGSPSMHIDDFESVEPNYNKSTGKRLKRTFQVYVNN